MSGTTDLSVLDRPEVLSRLFHPRKEWSPTDRGGPSMDVLIPVDEGVEIGARFHMADKEAGNLLFFHGNGEIVADYDDLAPLYNRIGINFLAVDYRGYGRSTGNPTVVGMMRDCHAIFRFVKDWLGDRGYSGGVIPMGRSLGSASVLEIAANHGDHLRALIVESGFAFAVPLLRLLGVDAASLGFREQQGFRNLDKIARWEKPLLIIHGEFDHVIPFSDAQALHDACPSREKTLLKIRGADHNDLFARGLMEYMGAVKKLVDTVQGKGGIAGVQT